MELPPDFIHEPPKGYTYEVKEFKRNVLSIWTCNHCEFVYNGGVTTKCIWGFYNEKQRKYYAPANSRKQGKVVNIDDTSPYTAMQILKPLAPIISNFYE